MPAPHSQPPPQLSAPAPALRSAPSSIGGRYHVLEQLGRGGMGVVYRVRDGSNGGELALKQLVDPEGGGAVSPRIASLFEREFHVLAELAHPRVIAVYDYGHDPAGPFYTMELLDGGDLKALAPVDPSTACRLLFEVCSSLALLHSRRLVHRDVSPRNVRCTRDGHAKLIDFGAMVPMGPCSHTVGTPGFIAPEVVHHAELDARTDLFSLGATLYYTLTGRAPFAARHLGDLREAWGREPPPPSLLVAGIPPVLDALCAALLRIDPAQRPGSAFEVMQRLQAAGGLDDAEPLNVSRAYLTTPALVAREDAVRTFRQRMRHAIHEQGSALCYQSAPGLGRSRLLDACALEAKTLGAIVVRAAGGAGAQTPFAVTQQLATQLNDVLPEGLPLRADSALLVGGIDALGDPALDAGAVQAGFAAAVAEVCATRALLIAVDDVQRIDEHSLASLAALAIQAADLRVLVLVTCDDSDLAHAPPACSVLLQHCERAGLSALGRAHTETLLGSVFGQVPHLPLLADRLYAIALGNPRETLALVRHLVDAGEVRYEGGRWTLPAELDARALPASAADAFTPRVDALPPLARRLCEAQALHAAGTLRAADYALLAPDASSQQLEAALSLLVAQEIVRGDGEWYSLSHGAVADALRARLDDETRRARNLALYELLRPRADTHPHLLAHHLLEAGRTEQALDLLAQSAAREAVGRDAISRGNPRHLAVTLERALALAVSTNRPAREAYELRRRLYQLAVSTEVELHRREGAIWLARLELDSGLSDYRAQPSDLAPGERLQRALVAAATRHAQSDERARVYPVDEAIKHLATYVVTSIVLTTRAADRRALSALPDLLEPFAVLTPVLFALWQNALALKEAMSGQIVRARRRWGEVYERLGQLQPGPGVDLVNVEAIRCAVAFAIGNLEATQGRAAAFEWAAKLDAVPQQRVGAMHLRRIASAMRGDRAGAARYAREGELLALRTSARAMFDQVWVVDLFTSGVSGDLAGVKRVVDGVAPLAARMPGWLPLLRLAEARFAQLRGDRERACSLFEQARALSAPDGVDQPMAIDVWIGATAGLVNILSAMGRTAEAVALGERALVFCAERQVELLQSQIDTALALAEARNGSLEAGVARVERVLRESVEHGANGIGLSVLYEVRARIAILARDASSATRFAAAAIEARGGERSAARAQLGELVGDARSVGVELTLGPTEFEASVLGTSRADVAGSETERVWATLVSCDDGSLRLLRALELLCESAGADGGQLYLADAGGELVLRATRNAEPPDAAAVRFARGFFEQQIDDAGMTSGITQATRMLSVPGAAIYVDERGREQRVLVLTCKDRGVLLYLGLAVLGGSGQTPIDVACGVRMTAIAACLLRSGDSPGRRVLDDAVP